MAKNITESVKLSAKQLSGGRIRIKIIDAGEGSSGVYPASTVELAHKEGVFTKGLHMYADHPTAQEGYDRPERTIKDLAAVLETDAWHVPEESALYADAKVFPGWQDAIKEMAEDIGVSIRASAEIEEADTPGGKPTITRIVEAFSVDFVTKAGRGGRIAEVLESAGAAGRAVEKGVAESSANETREMLDNAVRKTRPEGYAWVRDFDDTTVWYSAEDDGLYAQAYTASDTGVELTGEPTPVVARITYIPLTAAAEAAAPTDSPSNPAGVTESRKEPTVATTNIEESALAELQAQASRAAVLEADNAKLHRQVLAAEAAKIVAEAFDGITAPRTVARLSESFTVKEDGTLDADALKAEAEESAAEWKVSRGEGSVRGLGEGTTPPAGIQESASAVPTPEDIVSALKGA